MDPRQYMLIDTQEQGLKRFITTKVDSIRDGGGFWHVRFVNGNREFSYRKERLVCLTDPVRIELGERGVYRRKRRLTDIAEMWLFADKAGGYYYVVFANQTSAYYAASEIYVARTAPTAGELTVWYYLLRLADETGLLVEGNVEHNLLSRQYAMVDLLRRDTPLTQYLGEETELRQEAAQQQVIYPFGCNASQKLAVERALTNQLSIIQGPPGTGKTQTILNIIANLMIAGKTVLVVSCNNSAVDNVAEKLGAAGLGFLVAKLGSNANCEAFAANQVPRPDMSEWLKADRRELARRTQTALEAVGQGFANQLRRAQLTAELDALQTESRYDAMLHQSAKAHWLERRSSKRLMRLLGRYRLLVEQGRKPSLLFRLGWGLLLGPRTISLLGKDAQEVTDSIETAYYAARLTEINRELAAVDASLASADIAVQAAELRDASLALLKEAVARRYKSTRERELFDERQLKGVDESFRREYPVVLSTTYSAKRVAGADLPFDYVIMDEASQVDIKTGALALSCALNAVIVGDDKQLPNVVGGDEATALGIIRDEFEIDSRYDAATHSFLQSVAEVLPKAPVTLLREHYRCHPKIIEFCNRLFYGGELVAMTADRGEADVLRVVRTVKGNHAREHFNQREVDVIRQEVMPMLNASESLGIVTPYREQARHINEALGRDVASTVHKFQGRECDAIVMSMVDNAPTAFSDDANLLNVAVSRAKTHLSIVATGNELPPDSILAQLIGYIQYNNFEVRESKLRSVFDLLYKQYTAERLAYEASHRAVSEHLSETLVYNLLVEALSALGQSNLAVVGHYPLSKLIGDWSLLDEREREFAASPMAHVDFLIYNTLTKQPLRVVEVDGWSFHARSRVQTSRDECKDAILGKFGLTPLRIATNETLDLERMKALLA